MSPEPPEAAGLDADDREDRTRRFFGAERLARIRGSHVLVVGAGAVGNEVAKNLALLGVGRLTLVDRDTVERSNLNRCIFFRERDVGRRKVHVARRALRAAAPGVAVAAHAKWVQDAPDAVWDADAVALCVDDEFARYYVNARLLGGERRVPVVNGAMGRTWAEVRVLVPGRTACLVCLWSAAYARDVLQTKVKEDCDEFFARTRERFPSISVLTSIVGGMASTEVAKLLADAPDDLPPALGKLIRYDIREHEMTVGDVAPNAQCVDALCRRRRREGPGVE
jgi:molybdopterin/thiamine biosynthesis adenylyltransferase